MVSVSKCIGIMAGVGVVTGGASTYFFQSKFDRVTLEQAKSFAKDGKISVGGRTKDGKMWDGQISVDEFKKSLSSKRAMLSGIIGLASGVLSALMAGLTLALRGKVK